MNLAAHSRRVMRNNIAQLVWFYGPTKEAYYKPLPICSVSAKALTQPSSQKLVEDKNRRPVSGDSIRTRFLEFYAARGHKILPSSSLVPEDKTVFLTIAGMIPFKPIFLGKETTEFPRVTTCQKCVRINDIENVGHTSRHQTFFEMLGNFSFGDYYKQDAIKWAWELLTVEFEIPADRLWISVYEQDEETLAMWLELGIPAYRIIRLGEEDNFWTSGATGPCGPCSEIYYDFHPEQGCSNIDLGDDNRFLEVYNLVFMQYNRKDGLLEPLKRQNIDTGLGLERMARILQKVPNTYETDLIYPIIEKAAELANIPSYALADESTQTYLKIISDHMRAVVYLISDEVLPSNTRQGYIVRLLTRRAVKIALQLGVKLGGVEAFLAVVAEHVIKLSSNIDAGLKTSASNILDELGKEVKLFDSTLKKGKELLEQKIDDALLQTEPCISGKDAFRLYDTYGLPIDITKKVAGEHGVRIDMDGFHVEKENQRRRSQAGRNRDKLSVENGAKITEKHPDNDAANRVDDLKKEALARAKAAVDKASSVVRNAITVGSIKILVENMGDMDVDSLKSAAEYLVNALDDPAAVVLGSCPNGKIVKLVAAFSREIVDGVGIEAGKFIVPIAEVCGGRGGGRANFAQAGGTEPNKLPVALEKALQELVSILCDD